MRKRLAAAFGGKARLARHLHPLEQGYGDVAPLTEVLQESLRTPAIAVRMEHHGRVDAQVQRRRPGARGPAVRAERSRRFDANLSLLRDRGYATGGIVPSFLLRKAGMRTFAGRSRRAGQVRCRRWGLPRPTRPHLPT